MNKSLHRNLVSVRTLCQRERKTLPVLARFLFRFECLLTKYIWCGYTQLCELLIYSYSLYLTIRIFYPQIKSNRFYFNSPIFLKKQLKVELIKNTYLEFVEQVQQTLGPFLEINALFISRLSSKGSLFLNCRINEIFFVKKFLMFIWRTECITTFNNDF